jgi:hypothetical protein
MLLLVVTLELFARIEVRAALLTVVVVVVRHDDLLRLWLPPSTLGLMWRAAAERRSAARTVPVFCFETD